MRLFHQNRMAQHSIYPEHPWQIIEAEFKAEHNHHNETVFAQGNGYLGVRGTLEEGFSGPSHTSTPGVYINGIYDAETFIYGEELPQEPLWTQSLVNLPDWTRIQPRLDDEPLDMLQSNIRDYRRILDMLAGTLKRTFIWRTRLGREVHIESTRLVSLSHRHVAALEYRLTSINYTGEIELLSLLDGRVANHHHFRNKKRMVLLEADTNDNNCFLVQKTKRTGFVVGFAAWHRLSGDAGVIVIPCREEDKVGCEYRLNIQPGQTVTLYKYVAFHTSREVPKAEIKDRVLREAKMASDKAFDFFKEEQRAFLDRFWQQADIEVYGDVRIQQGLRFNAFHLLQSTGKDGITSIAAKGLTGEFYEGHYFWDVEIYIFPFYLYTDPDLARALLLYRYSILDQARANARRFKCPGALYAWRTINGYEASGYFMGSSVQSHINADIVFALACYVEVTDDWDFLADYGAEIAFETARYWCGRGGFVPNKGGKFCINEVCGPDEYKPGVNNNAYTNYMAKFNLEYACEVAVELKNRFPEKWDAVKQRIDLTDKEIARWQIAAARMYLPFNEDLGIHPQDDTFLDKETLDVDGIPLEDFPLVRNWHPLVIWRYQIVKQADVVLLMLLLGDRFSLEIKKANFNYYEPITTHDSSLSPAIYCIAAAELNRVQQAYNYFIQTVRIDLDDYNNNAYQGIHAACMGGSWLAVIYGFAGMRTYRGMLAFNPHVPENWRGFRFNLLFRGRKITVKCTDRVTYELVNGNPLVILHIDEEVELIPKKPVTLDLKK